MKYKAFCVILQGIARSSNGRTRPSEGCYLGSSPSLATSMEWLNKNSNIADWITAIVAVIAIVFTVREFLWKRRPFIDIEIQVGENPRVEQGGWVFFGL